MLRDPHASYTFAIPALQLHFHHPMFAAAAGTDEAHVEERWEVFGID